MATALTFRMCLIAVLHSSCSVPHLFPSSFFMAECTWCCLDVAWVSIDFFSLCCVNRCLMQEFRRTHSFAGAHCSFFVSSTSPSLFIPHKKNQPISAWRSLGNPCMLVSLSRTPRSCIALNQSSRMDDNLAWISLNCEENISVTDSLEHKKPVFMHPENVGIKRCAIMEF